MSFTGRGVRGTVKAAVNATVEDERELMLPPSIGEKLDIGFATENKTLAGFFRFVNVAKVTYPDGTVEIIPVKGAYLEAGGYLMLYICYPYFNGGKLEHDPSLGLKVTETLVPEATEPEYVVPTPE
jgi:hypothetical protein